MTYCLKYLLGLKKLEIFTLRRPILSSRPWSNCRFRKSMEPRQTVETESPSLQGITLVPPLASYPLIRRTVLVKENTSPQRPISAILRLTFAYPPGISLPLSPSAQHVKVVRPGSPKAKSYTPTSDSKLGEFDLVIKVYRGGGTSEWLSSLPLGTPVSFIGPLPPPSKKKIYSPGPSVIILALGIGITKGYTAARAELRGRPDCNVTLVYCMRFKEESLFEDEIRKLTEQHAGRFRCIRMTSGERVAGLEHGRITTDIVKKLVADTDKDDVRFLVVGTKAMINSVWEMLATIGFSQRAHSLSRKPSV
eukprot:GFKZ01014905.1.p1 GENE.GFKZ01014905.1~~GFKZ01014905.1.p1  ORF type:complete len:307 (-),score=21.32 GFKZ01014905.1:324-1244(-)